MLNQTSPNFKIILVCNEPPLSLVKSDKIIVTKTDLPCPSDYAGVINDIYQKIKIGMCIAKPYQPSFVMRVDADDFVSNQLVAFTEKNKDKNGWYFDWGYTFDYYSKKFYHQPKVHLNCGTAHVVRVHPPDFPDHIDTPKEDWLECIWQHQHINRFLTPLGRPVTPLPFPGVVRSVNTGVNSEAKPVFQKNKVKRFVTEHFLKKRIDETIQKEFSLPIGTDKINQLGMAIK